MLSWCMYRLLLVLKKHGLRLLPAGCACMPCPASVVQFCGDGSTLVVSHIPSEEHSLCNCGMDMFRRTSRSAGMALCDERIRRKVPAKARRDPAATASASPVYALSGWTHTATAYKGSRCRGILPHQYSTPDSPLPQRPGTWGALGSNLKPAF